MKNNNFSNYNIINVYNKKSIKSGLVTQILYGETFKIISKYIRRDTLEVGPGTGNNVNYYKRRASKITLLEINRKLTKSLKKKFYKNKKVRVLNSDIYSIKEKFDTIMYMDVLEHIKADKREIKKAVSLLNSDGYLIIFVPAFQILYSSFDKDIGHVRSYRKFFF